MLSDEYYRLFGLERNASSKDIKIIYRKLVKRFHPDSLEQGASPEEIKSAEEYFKRMQEAYEAIYSDALNRENIQGNREREELERRQREEKEGAKKKDEEERLRRQREEAARLKREQNERGHEEKSSGGKWFFGAVIFFAVLALGWYGAQDSSNSAISTPQKTTPYATASPIMTAKVTPYAAVVTPSSDQKNYTNSIGMEFVLMPSGEFDMGSPWDEFDVYQSIEKSYEIPMHRVKLERIFFIGKYEVTQRQWSDIMGNNPSGFRGEERPVDTVSWNDVQEFIRKLNEKEFTKKYRLPSEAEWEYSLRAGTSTLYSFGNSGSLGDYAWFSTNNGSRNVGQKKPNPWGLYDMHGNVHEWVQDRWHENYKNAPTDGNPWENEDFSSDRVFRDCSANSYNFYCRSAVRNHMSPTSHHNSLGFRLVKDL
ncbi:MAG: SUMF1/EgtB/PvdO family nonheme iron enzyme [Candidatus Methanoperedens sp.]